MGNRLAEMARMRLEYDEARKKIQDIQQQLADLEEKVTPGQAESDKDRYANIFVNTRSDEMYKILKFTFRFYSDLL